MLNRLYRTLAAAAVGACVVTSALPARADGIDDAYQQVIVTGANQALKSALDAQRQKREAAKQKAAETTGGTTVAQAPPVPQQPIGGLQIFPKGFTYTADISMAYPYGNIGSYGKQGWLMGGMDGVLNYSINGTTRVTASLYELQHWPYGFNTGFSPVYLAGFKNPVGCVDLSGANGCGPGTGRDLNVRTKDEFGVFMLSKVVFPLEHLGIPLPLVISPTYVARGGYIGESTSGNDIVPFTYNLPDGPVVQNLALRTAQYQAVVVTLPFLKTPKMFGTFSVASQWLVHKSGINGSNTFQTPQILYLEYTPTTTTTLWVEPQSARDYLPTDPYPEHLVAYFAGISQRVTKYSFVQVVLNSGGPTNEGADGILGVKCLNVAQALNNTCGIAIGGLKATQIQLQLGFGSPGVFPL